MRPMSSPVMGGMSAWLGDLAVVQGPSFWMPARASTAAVDHDWLFYFILSITAFFTVLITVVMIYFVLKYRHREGAPDPGHAAGHSTALEVTWTVIPTIIVFVIFFFGFRGYLSDTVIPPDAMEVRVTGRMWNWWFEYPEAGGGGSDVLYLPVNRPVQFVLQSEDVIHSLYVPAFRLKKDVVPGRFNKFWATPTQVGEFTVLCTEYCGTNHSTMLTVAQVMEPDAFREKMVEVADIFNRLDPVTGERVAVPLPEVGATLSTGRGCMQCHSLDGSSGIGPTWQNLWMAERPMTDGRRVVADEEYIRTSILYPQREIVAGYGGNMPSYLGSLNDREIGAIIEYIKTLSDGYKVTGDGRVVGPDESTGIGGPRSEGFPGTQAGDETRPAGGAAGGH